MMRKRVIVLISGMDSLIALKKAKVEFPDAEVIGVYYDLGQPFTKAEMKALPIGTAIRTFRGYLDMLEQHEVDGYIYYPSLFEGILYDAIRTYQPDVLWLGILATDSNDFRDNSLDWVTVFNDKFPNTEIDYPLARMGLGKKEAVEYGIKIGVDPQKMIAMHHCRSKFYDVHGDYGCGSCFSCMRKKSIFEELGYDTKIPSPQIMPTKLIDRQMNQYAEMWMAGIVPHEKFQYMSEILHLLESEFAVKDDVFKLCKEVQDCYQKNRHVIDDLMEAYDE